jgi:TolB-like protein/Tfp pilus assembly protein PilF
MQREGQIPDEKIRELLQRILESRSFDGVGRLKRFLSFIVLETLAGRGDSLKEFAVGEYAFDKGVNFDPRNDPIVRVQARRLRDRLTRYQMEEGQNDEIVIDLPKGRYVPNFRRREMTQPERRPATILLDRNSVAVLPFEPHSASAEVESLCMSITQEITHALTAVDGLTVLAAGITRSAEAVAAPVGRGHGMAANVVTGSVQKLGAQLRIMWQLVDSASGGILASESMDCPASDVSFALQEDVAAAVSRTLRQGLSDAGWKRGAIRATRNLAAHNLYSQGRYHLEQRTEESLRLAVTLFERAISEDSHFAKAHAGLADAYELLGHYGVLAPVDIWTKAPSSATMAVLLDERDAEAHVSLAHVRSTQDWDWAGSEEEFRRALALDPNNPTAHHWYAMSCLAPMGRLDEALESIQIARRLSPLSPIIARDCATVFYYRREYEAALESCDQSIELNPYFSQAYWTLGFIQEERKDTAESAAAFTRALELAPGSPRNKGALGRMFGLMGKKKEARRVVEELMLLGKSRYVSPYQIASIYFALGETDCGFEWLRRAFNDRCFELTVIKVDPKFDKLRSDALFVELAAQLKLP